MNSIANGTNTVSVITSCRILSCASESVVKPIRFAGTWSMYSKNAMPHETTAANHHGRSSSVRRCPYQANVMKRLDNVSSIAHATAGVTGKAVAFIRGAPSGGAGIIAYDSGMVLAEEAHLDPRRPMLPYRAHARRECDAARHRHARPQAAACAPLVASDRAVAPRPRPRAPALE